MPALIIFIGLFILALVGGALLSYPAYSLLSVLFEVDFERVTNRCVLAIAVALFFLLFKKFGFNSWRDIGYNANQKEFWSKFPKGFSLGVLIMLPVVTGLLITQNRFIDVNWDWSINNLSSLLLTALLAGIIIAFIEETLFRGTMLTAIQRQSSIIFAIFSTSFIYAIVHFLEPDTYLNPNTLNWASGFIAIKNAFLPLLQPIQLIDSFIALFLAGIFLALVKLRTNKLALCIGIHAGWVFTIKIFKRLTNSNINTEYAYLTGSYDKVIGYLAAFCIAIAIIIYISNKTREEPS